MKAKEAMSNTDFCPEELNQIEELRNRLQDLSNDEYGGSYLLENSTLWRYVLAKSREENPMDSAENMFRSSVSWRKEIDMKEVVREWRDENGSPRSVRARFGDLCFYGRLLPHRSIRGGPILLERLGKLDLQGLYRDECNPICNLTWYSLLSL
jgi:hypothetical protein